MELQYSDKNMTVYELAQLVAPILLQIDSRLTSIENRLTVNEDGLKQCATKDDLKQYASKNDYLLMEKRLTRKIDQNYVHVNKRVDLLSEKVS